MVAETPGEFSSASSVPENPGSRVDWGVAGACGVEGYRVASPTSIGSRRSGVNLSASGCAW